MNTTKKTIEPCNGGRGTISERVVRNRFAEEATFGQTSKLSERVRCAETWRRRPGRRQCACKGTCTVGMRVEGGICPGNTEKASAAGAEQGRSDKKVGTKQSSQESKRGAPLYRMVPTWMGLPMAGGHE